MIALPEIHFCLVSALTFLPLLGALALFLVRADDATSCRRIALAASSAPILLALRLLHDFDLAAPGLQFTTRVPWISFLGIDYHVGVDGLSLALLLLVSVLAPLTIFGSVGHTAGLDARPRDARAFFALMLVEQTGLYGTFTALNFFHWFIFWEASLVPMFFLVKMFGGKGRTAASYQFFVYTFLGSVAMLLGMQLVYLATGTWDLLDLARMGAEIPEKLSNFARSVGLERFAAAAPRTVFLMVLIGFAVKVPMWPLHTWLPRTYGQAPIAGAILLTGLMSKMGVYGLLRIVLPLFGTEMAQLATPLMLFALATVLLGAWTAAAQKDLRGLISYSSVSHLGYCLLGVFAVGAATGRFEEKALALNGVIFQMVAHGLSATGLFYFAGAIEARFGGCDYDRLGGLRRSAPVFAGLMGLLAFAALGLPGLAGFVGEFMIFRGVFGLSGAIACAAVLGLLLTAFYLLTMLGKIFFGPAIPETSDLTLRERAVAAALSAGLFLFGVLPEPLIRLSNAAVSSLVRRLG
ncbi:MAG: NADH-quinone oxidoreductase subunit M [Verrucomicrobiae bacterium]|nr:NADH-quinone oxidoreductase subunit M [Verrucomicrobiae bacterium]